MNKGLTRNIPVSHNSSGAIKSGFGDALEPGMSSEKTSEHLNFAGTVCKGMSQKYCPTIQEDYEINPNSEP